MKKKSKDLIFISKINRDGSGIEMLNDEIQEQLQKSFIDEVYKLNVLSLSNKTYIASAFNSYVVKIKENGKKRIKDR